jgi:hypothetical protein
MNSVSFSQNTPDPLVVLVIFNALMLLRKTFLVPLVSGPEVIIRLIAGLYQDGLALDGAELLVNRGLLVPQHVAMGRPVHLIVPRKLTRDSIE